MKQNKIRRLLSPNQLSLESGYPLGGLRHLIFTDPKGFNRVVRRIGRKVLLDVNAFHEWIDEINGVQKGGDNDVR